MEQDQLKPLTSLRFIAAAMIVFSHSAGRFGLDRAPGGPIVLGQAVSFFFVLSGFLMAHLYPRLTLAQFPRFLLARVARVWPLHVLCLLFTFLFLPTMAELTADHPAVVFFNNLTLTQAWVPMRAWYFSFNGVSWSASTSLFFYLCFPLLIHDLRRTWHYKLLVALVLAGALILVAGSLDANRTANQVDVLGLTYISPLSRLFEFVLGMSSSLVFARLAREKSGPVWRATLIEAGVLLVLVSIMYRSPTWAHAATSWAGLGGSQWLRTTGFVCVFFAALIVTMAIGRGWISKLLSSAPLVYLGEISFAVFLLHQVLLHFIIKRAPGLWESEGMLAYAGFWAVLLLLSDLMWRWVESPARVWLLRLFGHRSSRHAATSTPSQRRWRVAQVFALGVLLVVAWSPAFFATPAGSAISSASCAALAEEAARAAPDQLRGAVERVVRQGSKLIISGWATDAIAKEPARDVKLCWNGRAEQPADSRFSRPDLVKLFASDAVLASGFTINMKLDRTIPERCEDLVVFARAANGSVAQIKAWNECRMR